MTSGIARRIVARFKRGRMTEDFVRIDGLVDVMAQALRGPSGYRGVTEADVVAVKGAAKELYDALTFDFEDAAFGKRVEKHFVRIKNFRKSLLEYTKVNSAEELQAYLKSQNTKSKSAFDKFREWSHDVLRIIALSDSEIDAHLDIDGYSVVLITSPEEDWSRDKVERLQTLLREANRTLAKVGMGRIAGGKVLAYPSSVLPASARGSGGAYASYSLKTGVIRISTGDGPTDGPVKSMVHELGHRAYFTILGSQGRAAWEAFFGDNVGAPDVDRLIREWEAYASSDGWEAQKYGRWSPYFYQHLKKTDPEMAVWFSMIHDKAEIKEEFSQSGAPKKGQKPGLDQLIAKKSEIKVFLHPVTAYSGTDASELFAETFAHYALQGASRIPEIVRHAFHQALPGFRSGSVL